MTQNRDSTNWNEILDPIKSILWRYWQTSRGTLMLVVVVVFFSSVTAVAAPYVFSRFIDQITTQNWLESSMLGFGLYAILLGTATALGQMMGYLVQMSTQNLAFIARTAFFDKLLKKTDGFFVEHNPAEIQSVRGQGQQALNVFTQLSLVVFIPVATQITLTLIVLGATINMEIVLIVLVYGVAFITFTYFVNKKTRPFLEAAVRGGNANAKFVGNALNSMETLRHFNSNHWMSSQFSTRAKQVRDSWVRFCLWRIGFSGVYGVALAVQFAITFALLLPRYRTGDLSVGDVVLFNAFLIQLNKPFESIGQSIDETMRSYTRFLPFAEMWSALEEPEPATYQPFTLTQGHIIFDTVSFDYDSGRGISDISFSAARGKVNFITGETGSGKSTVFRLILKSVTPKSGKITVDDTDLQDIARADWFKQIGVVPQELMLLNETLRVNIVLGRDFDEKRLRKAAKKAAILEFIDSLPEGFDTTVGERGLKLSGGERQRVAIARALYDDPKILFLDEASSALDAATEADIMAHIRTLTNDVTVIAITHRNTVITAQDNIVLLGDKKLKKPAKSKKKRVTPR